MKNATILNGLRVPRSKFPGKAVRVVEIDSQTDPRWQVFVESHPDAVIYHHPLWLQALNRENGAEPICLACEDGNSEICGILPLVATRGLPGIKGQLAGRRLSSLPRTPVAGPLTVNTAASTALLRAVADRVDNDPGSRLQIKVASAELDGFVEGMAGHRWRPYYFLELPENTEDLHFGNARSHARIRSAVNKAEKLGLRVRESDSELDLRAWYLLY